MPNTPDTGQAATLTPPTSTEALDANALEMPPIVDANDLRWLAEDADGHRGENFVVGRGPHGKLALIKADDAGAAKDSIRVRTEFEGDGGLHAKPRVTLVYKGTRTDISEADAVFWSQSSFEKFVLPYYTRFKTPAEIAGMKRKYLNDPSVAAVLHFPPSLDKPFPTKQAFRSLHVDGDKLRISEDEGSEAGPDDNATDTPQVVTANDLRWLAEDADGHRGEDFVIGWGKHGKLALLKPDDPRAENLAIRVRTDFEGRGGLRATPETLEVEIRYDGAKGDVSDADAVFWSQSSFEKFVIPYYMRFRSPSQVGGMKNTYFNDATVAAVLHFPPSLNLRFPPQQAFRRLQLRDNQLQLEAESTGE